MENLIINGIDYSKFDLEWAKRGGVCTIDKTTEQQYKSDSHLLLKMLKQKDKKSGFFVDLLDKDPLFRMPLLFSGVRMATPDECAEAGIEYIEPPACWLPIESAPRDGSWVQLWRKPETKIGVFAPLVFGRWSEAYETWIFVSDHNDIFTDRGKSRAEEEIAKDDFYDDDSFTHWMPLPQPPKDA